MVPLLITYYLITEKKRSVKNGSASWLDEKEPY